MNDPFNPDGPVALGEAASSMLDTMTDGDVAVQDSLEGTEYTKVKFVGMSFDSLDDQIKIGDELTFTVQARCVGVADEASKRDSTNIRHIVKMDVQSVILKPGK